MASIEAQIQETCVALLDIALNTVVGATEVPVHPSRARTKDVHELLQWRQHELRLRAEIMDYKAAAKRAHNMDMHKITDGEMPSEEINKLDEQLHKNIAKLQDELFECSSKYQKDELLIRRVIQVPLLLNALHSKQPTEDSKYIIEAAKSRDYKVVQFMKHIQQLKQTQARVDCTKKTSTDMQVENSRLCVEMHSKKGGVHVSVDENSPLQGELSTIIKRTNILRHVLRSLVLESGVNWARQKELCDFMLKQQL